MSDKLTSASIQEFLQDYLTNSETSILEEGKEKDDILEVAEARGYNLKGNSDLAGFKTIFTFADKANKNKARLPKEKLLKALPGMIGKPVDIDHIRNYVVGHYIDYRYKVAEDMVIAYGVFYKSNFGDEWDTAQKLFKAGKLGTSYEIWCPKSKRKQLSDGTYELTEMEIAGGGLMFKEKPAFEDAKILEMAKKHVEENSIDLVIASVKIYDNDEIISSAAMVAEAPVAQVEQKNSIETKPVVVDALVPPIVLIPKVLCGNCNKEFDNVGFIASQSEKKCPHCLAIVDTAGVVKYPPQIIDFNISCPSCRASNWKLIKNEETQAQLKCGSCNKNFNVGFEVEKPTEILSKISFVYISSASCPQCGNSIPFSTTSQVKTQALSCKSCGLKFNTDIAKQVNKRKIVKIEESADMQTASAEGGKQEMDSIEEIKNQNPEPVVPVETPVVEAVAAPVVETPVATVETPAETPVVAEVVTEVPVVEAPVAEVATPIVEVVTEVEAKPVELVAASEVVLEVAEVKPMKTQEEIDEMEKELCKAVLKNKKLKSYFKAACKKAKSLKTSAKLNKASEDEIVSVKSENDDLKAKIQLLETSAIKIIERKNMLGEFGKDLSEKDIMDDDKFEVAKVKKENELLKSKLETASATITVKSVRRSDGEIAQIAKSIDEKAFPKK